jgi:hypothetical protein
MLKMKKLILLSISMVIALVGCQSMQSPTVVSATALPTPSVMPVPVVNKNFKDPAEPWCKPASYDFGDFYCVGGELNLVAKGTGIATYNDGNYKDFILQVQMRLIGAKGAYGVVFRGNNDNPAFYVFEIHPDGKFQLTTWTQTGNNRVLIPWTESAVINKGEATNILEVSTQGAGLTLSANGKQLASITDNTFTTGTAGPVALEEGHAAVSMMKVWELHIQS